MRSIAVETAELVECPPRFTAEQAGIAGGWGEPQLFGYAPYGDGHTLRVVRSHIDALVLAAFVAPQPVEVCFDATGLLVFGLCWRFTSVTPETWEGSSYNYARDAPHWPVLECKDGRLMPESARAFKLQLVDQAGDVQAERRVLAPHQWSYALNRQVGASATANDYRDWYAVGCRNLVVAYPDPRDLAGAVSLQPGGVGTVNVKRNQWAVCENINPVEAP
jgi:hypothetical protein